MMTIDFGLELDGGVLAGPAWGHVLCGPQSLLALLELRLGLAHVAVSESRRAAIYRGFLEKVADARPTFFGQSLRVDGVGVAHELLRWRDELVLAGWEPSVPVDGPRLEQLAAVEKSAGGALPPGVGDRLRRVADELEKRGAGIGRLRVREPEALLPVLWARVLKRLGAEFAEDAGAGWTTGTPARDLERLGASLAGGDAAGRAGRLEGDDSLQVWEAFSETTLARAVAQRVRAARQAGLSVAVVASDGGGVLADAWRAEGLPAPGTRTGSGAFPIPQLMGLCLNLIWDPLDPQVLIDFLTHPVSPVPAGLRHRLASAVAGCPGISGPAWTQAFADAEQAARARRESDAAGLAQEVARIQSARTDWIELPRFPESGAERSEVAGICRRLAAWAGARAAKADGSLRAHFCQLAGVASEVADIVAGPGTISRLELNRWVEQALGDARFINVAPAEAGTVTMVGHPAALPGPHDVVIWFGWEATQEAREIPWTQAERESLAAVGVALPHEGMRRARELRGWKALLASVRSELLLARPRFRRGEVVRPHPLQARLQALSKDMLPIRDVDPSSTDACIPNGRRTSPHPVRLLPGIRRWWRLGRGVAPRPEESFTSLSMFIYHPHQWVLRYVARLKPGPLSELQIRDHAQAGSILDRLASDLFSGDPLNWRDVAAEKIEQWLSTRWDAVLGQMGLNLRQPGQRVGVESLRETARRVLVELARLLSLARVDSVAAQVGQSPVAFEGIFLKGIPDLICRRDEDTRVGILDLKLGGWSVREREVAESRALQLAIYRRLFVASNPGSKPPATGFYILGAQRLVTAHDFWGVPTVKCAADGDEVCWQDFLRMWRWRRDQLAEGWVEVVTPGAVETGGPPGSGAPPVATWKAEDSAPGRDPYLNLIGWNPLA